MEGHDLGVGVSGEVGIWDHEERKRGRGQMLQLCESMSQAQGEYGNGVW